MLCLCLSWLEKQTVYEEGKYALRAQFKDIKIYVPRTARALDGDIEHTELHDDNKESAAIAVDTEVKMNRKAITQPFTEMSADAFTSPKTSVRGIKYVFVLVDTVTKVCYPFLTRSYERRV